MVRFEPPGIEAELRMALTLLEKVTGLGAGDLSSELVDPNSEDLASDDIPANDASTILRRILGRARRG